MSVKEVDELITELKSTMYYLCPACGVKVKYKAEIFEFAGNRKIKVKCPLCGESELVARLQSDNRISISVPCIICEQVHRYVFPLNVVFGKEAFLLSCTLTDTDICSVGGERKSSLAFKELEERLNLFFVNGPISDY